VPAAAQTSTGGSRTARPLITEQIDGARLITLRGNVRADLTADRDLGAVEDELPLRLYLVLKRSPEQQADLDNLLARQQQPTAAEYHKWLTPQQFGERFGASQQDIAKISAWLGAQGLRVNGVLNNATMIDFTATAGQIRSVFRTELHYWNIRGGRYAANAQDPAIPAALAPAVAGIQGLNKIPAQSRRTQGHPVSYDIQTHRWRNVEQASGERPQYNAGGGNYNVTPQDFYTIYHVNPIFATGNLGAGATIGLPEPTDMVFGTVNGTTGAASGGDVATFRKLFGVPGTLNMTVLHGAGTVTCTDPGITDAVGEAALDAEWANAVAPSAHLVFMSCDDTSVGDGFTTALTALIDNNISDVISSSYGSSEAVISAADFAADDLLASQAAAQGQSFIDAAGDAGAADADQNIPTTAVQGINVDQFAAHPLVTAVGGTDFSDNYDAQQGGLPQSTYWGANSPFYGDALGYIPETPWNSSCADSIIANLNGFTGAGYCGSLTADQIDGNVVGGGGGFSAHYSQPIYQAGTPGLSLTATKRAGPDISFFAANGFWGHSIIECESSNPATACTSPDTFEGAGGTSFTAPQFAGVTALLVTLSGERQGTLNPALYALAKAQYAAPATATACYSNGQTNNIGVTTGLPAAACIFNDITTGNNDEPCAAGSLDCFVNAGAAYGMLSTTGAGSLTVAYPSGVAYDETTGLGSVNIANLLKNWNTAYTTTTGLTASPTSITSSESTTLTATVTPGTPVGYTGTAPTLTGTVSFAAGSTALGKCTLISGTCSVLVSGSLLQLGANSITAVFSGSETYPPSTSSIVTVTVSNGGQLPPITLWANTVLGLGQSGRLPVSIPKPAPTGGVTVTLVSSNPSDVTVTPSVFIPAGRTTPNVQPTVTGLNLGSVTITASAGGYQSTSQQVTVTGSITFGRCCVTVYGTVTVEVPLNLSGPAPAGGLTISLSSGNPAVASVPTTVTFAAHATTVNVPVKGVKTGTTAIQAGAQGLANVSMKVTVDP
jgi:subtilase family serine protease